MRLIDADELWKAITTQIEEYCDLADLIEIIEAQPTVDAEPLGHGRWVKNDNGTYSCSECHSWVPSEQHYYARYCLFCGAKMMKEVEKYANSN